MKDEELRRARKSLVCVHVYVCVGRNAALTCSGVLSIGVRRRDIAGSVEFASSWSVQSIGLCNGHFCWIRDGLEFRFSVFWGSLFEKLA